MSNTIAAKYAAVLKSRGGLREIVRRRGWVRVLDAGLREIWLFCGANLLRRLGRRPGDRYGWLESILFPAYDYWSRYGDILNTLRELPFPKPTRVLEVSSGRGGIGWFLRDAEVKLCLVDADPIVLEDARAGEEVWRICASGCALPFSTDSFDVAVSLDTVEHLPQALRPGFLDELKRVTKRIVLVTCPLTSDDSFFQGREFDVRLCREIEKRREEQPGWLREHLQHAHPTRSELVGLLPGAEIMGSENCDVWLRFTLLYQRKFLWIFSALFYVLALEKKDGLPPYRRAFFSWRKTFTQPQDVSTSR